jgi:hypothetical protein
MRPRKRPRPLADIIESGRNGRSLPVHETIELARRLSVWEDFGRVTIDELSPKAQAYDKEERIRSSNGQDRIHKHQKEIEEHRETCLKILQECGFPAITLSNPREARWYQVKATWPDTWRLRTNDFKPKRSETIPSIQSLTRRYLPILRRAAELALNKHPK